jgi:hypothetical protein
MNKQTQEALKMAHKTFMQLNERSPRKDDGSGYFDKEINACKEALEEPAQEPVAWIVGNHGHCTTKKDWAEKYSNHIKPLYTHPHQWQGLTDDEIARLVLINEVDKSGDTGFAKLIEQALKEKNHG